MAWQLSNISVKYGEKAALRDMSYTIREGLWISVIGQTGAGKSTFAKVLKGLIPDAEGEYLIDGQRVTKDGSGQFTVIPEIGYAFQYPEHQLFETTVYKELAFGPRQQGLPPRQIKALIDEILHEMGLSPEILEQAPFQLSGGLKRRVAIASILMMNPRMLILDEPTAGLDPVSRIGLMTYLKRWQRQNKRTVLFISHQMEDVSEYSDEVLVFHEGKLVGGYEPQGLFFERSQLLADLGLALPEPVQMVQFVEGLVGRSLGAGSCRESDIMEKIMPIFRAGRDSI